MEILYTLIALAFVFYVPGKIFKMIFQPKKIKLVDQLNEIKKSAIDLQSEIKALKDGRNN